MEIEIYKESIEIGKMISNYNIGIHLNNLIKQ